MENNFVVTNRDIIRMHLEEFMREYPDQTIFTLLGYCVGYYGSVDMDILFVVDTLHKEGKIR